MTVEIDDRTWNDFTVWAEANGMTADGMLEYVNRAFRDRFMTDKYGDLNERFAKPEPKRIEPEVVAEEPKPVITESSHDKPETDTVAALEEPEPNLYEAPEKPRKKVLKSR